MHLDDLLRGAPFLELPEPEPRACVYAQKFGEQVEHLLSPLRSRPTLIGVNQTKILLLDYWWTWQQAVPKNHRRAPTSHRCLFDVFLDAYQALKTAELALAPPLLFLPPEPPKPARRRSPKAVSQQIAHLVLGELIEDEAGDGH